MFNITKIFTKNSHLLLNRIISRSISVSALKPNDVVIVSAVRTPIGSINSVLASVTAPQLGSLVIKTAIKRAGINEKDVQEVIMGNVLTANIGQAPARQAALGAGLSSSVICTTINKVCSSGLKAVMLAASNILLGQQDVIIAGGMESMSNVPYYLDKARRGYGYGHQQLIDGVLKDGLWDVYNDFHMGNCAEDCAKKYNISREAQDNFALESYNRAANATKNGLFKNEIVAVQIPAAKKGDPPVEIIEDEEIKKLKADKVASLKPAFIKDGTVTAANASKLNDGAAALVIMSAGKAKELKVKPLAKIISFADAEQAPVEFTTAPAAAIPKALKKAGLTTKDIDYFEINEAFSVVALANIQLMGLDPAKVNVNGGAVALGHPVGSSGARILTTLLHILKNKKGKIGVAGICNGGGGASAIVIENVE